MIDVTETWASISPWNIWDLRYGDWLGYAGTLDARREAARNKPT